MLDTTTSSTSTDTVRDLEVDDEQEIRIAAVLNGGVSLAVWISGVVLELHHLALASQGLGTWTPYKRVLELLGASARIDVIAGTSAGGINGAFLALGLARRRDLARLRDIWTDEGSLEALLRPAMSKNPPSLLRGDDYFLVKMRDALARTIGPGNPELRADSCVHPPPAVELILTGTLWDGRESTFTDDMGVGITERDYDATFRFANKVPPDLTSRVGDLDDATGSVVEQLARASRCTSSFPGAFEPHYVTTGGDGAGDLRWTSSAGGANFGTDQYVLDGGILLNKPIRPALESIYRQTADNQVRRVLAYVVPDPGEPARTDARPSTPATRGHVPDAGEVVLAILTRLRSTDSVSRELGEIRDRNREAAERKRARARLSHAMSATSPDSLSEGLWDGYVSDRKAGAASKIGRLIAAGQPLGTGAWSEREITDALLRLAESGDGGFDFVPRSDLPTALASVGSEWHWGQTAVRRLTDLTADLLRRGLGLAPLATDVHRAFVNSRGSLATLIRDIQADNDGLDRFWRAQGARQSGASVLPRRRAPANTSADKDNLAELDRWIAWVVTEWDRTPTDASGTAASAGGGSARGSDPAGEHRRRQYGQALALASALLERKAEFASVIDEPRAAADPSGEDMSYLRALYAWLIEPATDAPDVLRRMLRLDVVLLATAGALAHEEQEVELVQVSSSDRSSLTGIQLYHFGAFYRAPWRVNDWIEGRLDGAKQTVRFLLSPERLRQRGYTVDALSRQLREIAAPAGRDQEWLAARWDEKWPTVYRPEIEAALGETNVTAALDEVADGLAMPLRLQILRDDLAALALAVIDEHDDTADGSRAWLDSYHAKVRSSGTASGVGPESATLSAEQLWQLREQMTQIGRQRIAADFGSDTFARTAAHSATVAASTLGSPPVMAKAKPLRFILSALRGYTAMVWLLVSYLTRGSAFGRHVVTVVAAAGGALLAVTILVPGVPIGLTLTGAGFLLAAMAASALVTPGATGVAWRLGVILALVLAGIGWFVYRDVAQHGFTGDVVTLTVKIGVAALIVVLGWFIATAGPPRAGRRPSAASGPTDPAQHTHGLRAALSLRMRSLSLRVRRR